MLEVRGITKEYDSLRVLDNVSFILSEGEKLSIRGESGCGKTTLLMIIAGLTEASRGEILSDRAPMDELPHLRGVSMVFQESTLWNNMTVLENIIFGSPLKNSRERKEKAQHLAESFGIEELLSRYPYEISGGQARRASIVRALLAERKILLLDEPFSNLDKEWKEKTMERLKGLCAGKCSVLLVTHSEDEAEYFCDRHLFMEEGRVI